jgi:hypothetical protein
MGPGQTYKGISLRGPWTADERSDLAFVVAQYERRMGPMARWGFVVQVLEPDPDASCGPTDRPTCGFPFEARGITNPSKPPHEVVIVPKRNLDRFKQWRQKYDRDQIVVGEERKHGFKWTLAHELAHALSYKLGIGQPWRHLIFYGDGPGASWADLASAMDKQCPGSSETPSGQPMRPSGYPTRYSSFWGGGGYGEAFADTVAYLLLGSTYANDDTCFAQKLQWVMNLFDKIRQGQIRPIQN